MRVLSVTYILAIILKKDLNHLRIRSASDCFFVTVTCILSRMDTIELRFFCTSSTCLEKQTGALSNNVCEL